MLPGGPVPMGAPTDGFSSVTMIDMAFEVEGEDVLIA
jgi:hypothetical protein